jgi:hypothetical protein
MPRVAGGEEMPIDVFDRSTFEAALPVIKNTRQPLWSYNGFVGGEHSYLVPVKPGIVIQVRSSVGADGYSHDSGQDSIRCWLTDLAGKPLGSKYGRWVTRVSGWERRLTETLRALWKFGRKLIVCPKCGHQMSAFKTSSGPNEGRWYMKCAECQWWDSWLTEAPKEKTAC